MLCTFLRDASPPTPYTEDAPPSNSSPASDSQRTGWRSAAGQSTSCTAQRAGVSAAACGKYSGRLRSHYTSLQQQSLTALP